MDADSGAHLLLLINETGAASSSNRKIHRELPVENENILEYTKARVSSLAFLS